LHDFCGVFLEYALELYKIPQGLKPLVISSLIGTTEVVP
jgi:hypothetical protein